MLTLRWRMFVGPDVVISKRDVRMVIAYYRAELTFQAQPTRRCPSCSTEPFLLELNHGVCADAVPCN